MKTDKNIIGINIKPQLPKKPDIIINNNFSKKPTVLKNILIRKIKKKSKFLNENSNTFSR